MFSHINVINIVEAISFGVLAVFTALSLISRIWPVFVLTPLQLASGIFSKLIAKKGNFASGMKTCKQCTNEYNEKENFNWSCRQHQSEYSGEMWWCCGKTTKEALGCKFRKHETKDDEEEGD